MSNPTANPSPAASECDPRALLLDLFAAAVDAARPENCLPRHLPPPPAGRTVVVGAGKAAAAMAAVVEGAWRGPLTGIVVVPYGHGVPCRSIEVVEAAHPVPDEAGPLAATAILERVSGLCGEDLVLCLISGGGSALLALPAPGLTLDDKRALTRTLLRCGASIDEINCVRKHLSAIKGGRLAAACYPARVVTLVISDVPGDDPAVVASGPTIPDPTSFEDARAVLEKYRVSEPAAVCRHLLAGADETPKPGDSRLSSARTVIVAKAHDALTAAARAADDRGVTPLILADGVEGEAREVARVHAAIALQAARHGEPVAPPCVLLSGGETTVTVTGSGRGGRNAEFLLALGVALKGQDGIYALACDTDGIDGTEKNAGCVLTPDSLARAAGRGVDARAALADNDGFGFFEALGDVVVTGPTRTNVNDFRAILVARRMAPAEIDPT